MATEIVTEGFGWVERPGDQAELSVEFAAVAPTRSEAVSELGVRLRPLERPVVAAQQVRDRSLWVQNEYRGDQVLGCRAAQSMRIVVSELAMLEDLVELLVAAEPSSLGGPRWSLADEAAARREAQRLAVDDARARAEGYALALGGTLGDLVRLAESPGHGHVRFAMAAGPAGGVHPHTPDIRELSLRPEPVQVTVSCTTTWTLVR